MLAPFYCVSWFFLELCKGSTGTSTSQSMVTTTPKVPLSTLGECANPVFQSVASVVFSEQ
ncbi:hypothetical protein D915_010119 [Fasciola hepatica]|uniref:Uncharacterized protein n=1 Tax=Fasciola hepatica TaxID=6192 RepID=A0A4E0RV20_FASHE|nr:hypothetical protein D915_010119 [Fasciola hepatica]